MTRKRYPKTARRSRSTHERRYPFERRYAALQTDDEHPVDVIIDHVPSIARLDLKLVRLSKQVQEQSRDVEGYLTFEDLRLEQRCTREEAFFDAGHEAGRIDGAIESLDSSVRKDRGARSFAQRLHRARLSSNLSADRAIAVLLEFARGLMLAQRPRRGRRSPR